MHYESLDAFMAVADKNPLRVKEAKEAGRRVAGMYCLYSPMEVLMAADAIPVMLCGTKQDPIPSAEKTLPRTLCPLIKSSFGFGVEETCPYFNAADIVIADTTCDGKTKMFEQMAAFKEMHLLHLPRNADGPEAMRYWLAEVTRLKERLEDFYGITITDADLERAIDLANRERDALDAMQRLMSLRPAPLTGMKMLELLFKSGFFPDKEEGVTLMQNLVNDVTAGPAALSEGPRVLLSGVPMGMGSHKVVQLLEEAGARVVGFENCTGYKRVQKVDTDRPPLEAIAARYLSTPCSVMTPNTARQTLLGEMIETFHADAVVDLAWQGCHTYAIEQHAIRQYVQGERGLPYMAIETDYSEADTEQLRVRIEAFLEMQAEIA